MAAISSPSSQNPHSSPVHTFRAPRHLSASAQKISRRASEVAQGALRSPRCEGKHIGKAGRFSLGSGKENKRLSPLKRPSKRRESLGSQSSKTPSRRSSMGSTSSGSPLTPMITQNIFRQMTPIPPSPGLSQGEAYSSEAASSLQGTPTASYHGTPTAFDRLQSALFDREPCFHLRFANPSEFSPSEEAANMEELLGLLSGEFVSPQPAEPNDVEILSGGTQILDEEGAIMQNSQGEPIVHPQEFR